MITTIMLLMLAAWLGPPFVVAVVLWWLLPTWLVVVLGVLYLVCVRAVIEEQRQITASKAAHPAPASPMIGGIS